jgi:hypothetical protein
VDDTPATGHTKRALRALAVDRDSTCDHERPRDVVCAATDALSHVERATRFLAADGAARLAHAVVRAVREGDDETVREGREALAALRSLQSALAGGNDGDSADWTEFDRQPESSLATTTPPATDAPPENHFHPARGTVLGGAGKRGDK